jgi:hypothetical protein
VIQDVRFGLRLLRKNPGFTAVAVLTLALGIGANTAIFSVIENTLLHPVPWKDPDRILSLWEIDSRGKVERQVVSPANFLDWRGLVAGEVFDGVAAWNFVYVNLTGGDHPEQVEGLAVTADYFHLLLAYWGIGLLNRIVPYSSLSRTENFLLDCRARVGGGCPTGVLYPGTACDACRPRGGAAP